jgi:hypothetical protein
MSKPVTHFLVVHPNLSYFSYAQRITASQFASYVATCKASYQATSAAIPVVAPYSQKLLALLKAKKSLYQNNANVYIFPKVV